MASESGEQGSMEAIGEEKGGDGMKQKPEIKGDRKGRSCAGYLYYTNALKTNNRNPRCIGIPRSLPHVPRYSNDPPEIEQSKEGRALLGFYYACYGYSEHEIKTESLANKELTNTELPTCFGLQVLVDRRVPNTDTASASVSVSIPTPTSAHAPTIAHAYSRKDRQNRQPQSDNRSQPTGTDFASRFTRNAKLVASAVARNVRRVGNHIKESIDDMLDPYKKRPR